MARIRTVKPEFWTSEQVTDCSTNARLLFIGIWNFCDDRGVIPFKPKEIKGKVFPNDDILSTDVRRMIDELVNSDLLGVFQGPDGQEYLWVTGWRKHQRIDRPSYKYPEPPAEIQPRTGQLLLPIRRTFDEGHPPEGKGREGKGKEGTALDDDSTKAISPDQARLVIKAFDDARVEAYGPMQARPWPHHDDLGLATKFLESGASLDLCATVFRSIMQKRKSGGKSPPGNLAYFASAIPDAIAQSRIPLPKGRAAQINGTVVPIAVASKDQHHARLKANATLILASGYQADVSAADVREMVKDGMLTRDDAKKAGYRL